MEKITLRDYQEEAHRLMVHHFKRKEKVLLWVMAGGGKSITAGSFINKYHKHFKFLLIVRKRGLVVQLAEDALGTFDLDYSIVMANHDQMDMTKPIQVASKDTLQARDLYPFLGQKNVIIMIDECDEFPDFQRELIKKYEDAGTRFAYFGMTASPFTQLDFFDVCIEPIKPKELLRRGILVPFTYHIPPLDFSDIGFVDGQWNKEDLVKKLDSPHMIASSYEWWLRVGENRQTLIFCLNVAHSKNMVAYINNYHEKEVAVHCDADTPKEDREKAIRRFKRGEITHISNIKLFVRGTNIIEIGCIFDVAPTLSINNHIQKAGRGSRQNPIYDDCIYLDIANNNVNNGPFYTERTVNLKSNYKKKKSDLDVIQMKVCEKCFRAWEAINKLECPFCGFKNKPVRKKKLTDYDKNKIFLETASEEEIERRAMIKEFKKELWKKENLGKRYRKDIARIKAIEVMIKKHGLDKVLTIKKSIGLTDKVLDKINKEKEDVYVPLSFI